MKNEHIRQLINLVALYPDTEIITATYYDVVCDEWGYWVGDIEEVKLDYFYANGGRWYRGEEEIKDKIRAMYEDMDMESEDDLDKLIDDKFQELESEGKIKTAIIVYINNKSVIN